jgi:16S rRNA (uracil1498-N3)-methyltransferase
MSSSPSPHAALRYAGKLEVGRTVALDAVHARGLALREIRPKEAFTLIDADDRFFRATLRSLGKREGEALVYEAMAASTESPVDITLLCAVLGRQRMLGVVQKATELGAMRIVPVLSARSVQRADLEHEKAHAWPAQAVRAARQCRRASLPIVLPAAPLAEALGEGYFSGADKRIHLDDRVAPTLDASARPRSIALVVGPEGGFTDEELELLAAHRSEPLRIGGRVLRAETAALVGLTIVQHAFGDM